MAYIADQVTLTSANTTYSLKTLLEGVLTGGICPSACNELNIQNANGNTASVLVGNSNLASTHIGVELRAGSSQVGDSRNYRAPAGDILDISQIYVRSGSATQKLNIEILT